MLTLDLNPEDEVIVPDMTWVASAAPVIYVGAKPVLVDVDSDSWCITASQIEKSITKNTKAVVVVDLLGNMPEWDEILDVCRKNNLFIIEDASEGISAKYKGKLAGTFGDISLFSFNATKTNYVRPRRYVFAQTTKICTILPNLCLITEWINQKMEKENITGQMY